MTRICEWNKSIALIAVKPRKAFLRSAFLRSAFLLCSIIAASAFFVIFSKTAAAQDAASNPPERAVNFSYQPGKGVSLREAHDLWSVGFSLETRLDIPFEAGRKAAGRIRGEPYDRRFRPFTNACLFHCIYELELEADLDEFRSNERHPTRLFVLTLQRSINYLHFENLYPLLPTFYFGFGYTLEINPYRRGDFTASAQLEYDLLSRNNGFDEGRFVNTLGLRWRNISLLPVAVPGTASVDVAAGRIGFPGVGLAGARSVKHVFEDNLHDFGNWKDSAIVGQIEPFAQVENKWLKGFGFIAGAWFCYPQRKLSHDLTSACDQLAAFDHGPGGRQLLFFTDEIGRGLAYYLTPGLGWRVGPYELRVSGGFQRFANQKTLTGRTLANNFLIAHELFLWSPKGFFTGSAEEAGSVVLGMHFERTDLDCNSGGGRSGSAGGTCGVDPIQTFGSPPVVFGASKGFNRNTILLREWDLWYFITTRMSVGVSFLWYRATNMPLAAQYNLGVRNRASIIANADQGKGGEWLDINLAWRWRF